MESIELVRWTHPAAPYLWGYLTSPSVERARGASWFELE